MWDPSFDTWQMFGVRTNSTMAILRGDLTTASTTFFGFGESEQQAILDALSEFS